MTAGPLKVVRTRQAGTRIEVVVAGPEEDCTVEDVAIADVLGQPVTVLGIDAQPEDGRGLLLIRAEFGAIDPHADAPSYLLTIRGEGVWFTLPSPQGLARPDTPTRMPPGSIAIDYLARDFTGLTAMMRARVAQTVKADSAWALDHPADPLTTILEVLAYAGDHLSFRQDAAGTESYLPTARRRLSLRRHGRLRDYVVNDGCTARTALVFAVEADGVLPAGLQVVTLQPGVVSTVLPPGTPLAADTTVFETMHPQPVSTGLNDLGPALARGAAYRVAAGSTTLVLKGVGTGLQPGRIVVVQQLLRPLGTDAPFGAQALRLLNVVEQGTGEAASTILTWHPEDALSGPLVVPPAESEGAVSLFGNVVLADHGATVPAVLRPDTVPADRPYRPTVSVWDVVSAAPPPRIAAGFDGRQPPAEASLLVESARASLDPDPATAAPCITLSGTRPGMPGGTVPGVCDLWSAERDLLASPATGRRFAASLEDDAALDRDGFLHRLRLRFGEDALGRAPAPGTVFTATARSGGGQHGRVRAGTLVQVVGPAPIVRSVTNPFPAQPAVAETDEAVRLFASSTFRMNLRGTTPDDWTRLAREDPLVREVEAKLGPDGAPPCLVGLTTWPDDAATFEVAKARLLDHAVLGAPPTIRRGVDVAVAIALVVYCKAGTNIAAARARLQQNFGLGALPDGSPAYFNTARWPLGRPVALHPLIAAITADPAVAFVVFEPGIDPRVTFGRSRSRQDTAANVERGFVGIDPHERVRVGDGLRFYVVASAR